MDAKQRQAIIDDAVRRLIEKQTHPTCSVNVALEPLFCLECCIPFAVPLALILSRAESREHFVCPNGHAIRPKESLADIVRRALDVLKDGDRVASLLHENEQLEAELSNLRMRFDSVSNADRTAVDSQNDGVV